MLLRNKQHLLVLASLYYCNKDLFHIKMKEDIDDCGWALILLRGEAEQRQSSIYRRDGGTVYIFRAQGSSVIIALIFFDWCRRLSQFKECRRVINDSLPQKYITRSF